MRLGIVLAALLLAAPAHAAPDGARLDELFSGLAKARSAEEAHQYEAKIWLEWADSGSDSVDLLMSRGLDALEDRDMPTAVRIFDAVTTVAPTYPEGWHRRAEAHALSDDYDNALISIQKTLELEPRHFGALAGLGAIFEEFGDGPRALEAYRRARDINPFIEGISDRIRRLEREVEGRRI